MKSLKILLFLSVALLSVNGFAKAVKSLPKSASPQGIESSSFGRSVATQAQMKNKTRIDKKGQTGAMNSKKRLKKRRKFQNRRHSGRQNSSLMD